jgi:shikimate dehydrogenase
MGSGGEGDDLPLALDALHEGQVLADLVYHPLETPLLRGAVDRGAAVVDGLGMLVHQAALQFERWTGHGAPVAAMRAAAERALRPSPPSSPS